MWNIDDTERLMDQALSEYGRVESPPGLERRILNRVRADGHKSRRRFWLVAAGIAVLAIALFMPRSVTPVHHPGPAVAGPDKAVEARVPGYRVPEQAKRTPVVRKHRLDRRRLSKEENALLMVARYSPKVFEGLHVEDKPVVIEPIEISALNLQPLQSGNEE
jgi:hypothetical protein